MIDTLKTKQKIENFSSESDIPVDYLAILKREASSYLPKPVKLSSFIEMESSVILALDNCKITNSKQLFNAVNSDNGISKIHVQRGVPVDKLGELYALSDLVRIYGVGPIFAGILYGIGITSVESFAEHTAEELIGIYENHTHKKADFSESDINFSIELAKNFISLR